MMEMVKVAGIIEKTKAFLKEVGIEFKKVVWPDKKFVFSATVIVLVIVLASAFYAAAIDFGFEKLFQFLSLLFRGGV
ncbi:MAG: preprotein translocase subunit SecE [Candidatus Margulisiibacteriota bacterium]